MKKKEYDLQIWQHNVCYTNIIAMKDVIITKKAKKKIRLSKGIADITTAAELAQVSSLINLTRQCIWAISNVDLDAAKELRLSDIKKYWRHAWQVKLELDCLHNWILILVTFMRYLRGIYNNKKVTKNIRARQDIDPEWVLFFFV